MVIALISSILVFLGLFAGSTFFVRRTWGRSNERSAQGHPGKWRDFVEVSVVGICVGAALPASLLTLELIASGRFVHPAWGYGFLFVAMLGAPLLVVFGALLHSVRLWLIRR